MNGYPQIISMPRYLKKILFSILVISVLSFFIFFGITYTKSNLSSLFSIITAWVTINPLEVKVVAPSEVEINKVFKVEAMVINKGEEKIENGKGEIFLPPGLVLLKKDPIQEIGIIPGKKGKKVFWSVKGEEIGNYVISVEASGELKGQLITANDSTTVVVKEAAFPGEGHRFDFFQIFFDFFQKWLLR